MRPGIRNLQIPCPDPTCRSTIRVGTKVTNTGAFLIQGWAYRCGHAAHLPYVREEARKEREARDAEDLDRQNPRRQPPQG